jgi:hypothetical protein
MGTASIPTNIDKKHDGELQMLTHKQDSPAVYVKWDGANNPTVSTVEDEDIPYGTDIRITKLRSKESLANRLRDTLAIRYHLANPINIVLNGERIETGDAGDPLYMSYVNEASDGWKYSKKIFKSSLYADESEWSDLRYEATLGVVDDDGVTHNVIIQVRDMEDMQEALNRLTYRDRPSYNDKPSSLFRKEYSGVYLVVDGITIVLGGSFAPYVSRPWVQNAAGIRVKIIMPKGLSEKLNYNLNKTKGFASVEDSSVFQQINTRLKDVVECFIQRRARKNEDKSKKKALTYNKTYASENKEVTFRAVDDSRIPRNVFALKNVNGDGFDLNVNSEIARKAIPKDGSMGKFDMVADMAALTYMAVLKAYEKVSKVQPPMNLELSPNQQARETRDFILKTIMSEIDNNFMSITFDD